MKKTLVTTIILAALALLSCKKECIYYMEGKKCETEVRLRYLGTYEGVLTVGNTSDNASSVVNYVSIEPAYFTIGDLSARLTSKTTFDIPFQNWEKNGTPYQAEGNGSFDNSQLKFNFIITYQGEKGAASFIGNKQ